MVKTTVLQQTDKQSTTPSKISITLSIVCVGISLVALFLHHVPREKLNK